MPRSGSPPGSPPQVSVSITETSSTGNFPIFETENGTENSKVKLIVEAVR